MDKQLVAELQQMFRDGATASMLMHRIKERFGPSTRLHFAISDYFKEAFGLPLIRVSPEDVDLTPNPRYAQINRDVVPELIQRINGWNTESLDRSWLKGLVVRSLAEHKKTLAANGRFDDFSRVWTLLNEEERGHIIQLASQVNREWEIIKCLSALAERLQQQVFELSSQLRSGVQRKAQ